MVPSSNTKSGESSISPPIRASSLLPDLAHDKNGHGDPDRLLEWDELLPWQKDNEFVLTGNRQASFSYLRSLSSVLRIHNETVNIWSHILGALYFLASAYALHSDASALTFQRSTADVVAILAYFVCIVICFAFSSIFHIFLDHSQQVRKLTCGMDYLGVIVPLWGTTVSSAHFGFRAEPGLRNIYLVMASIPAMLCAIVTFRPTFSGPTGRKIRTYAYLALGLSSFLPIAHGIIRYGFERYNQHMGLMYYLGLGVYQGTGAALYAARVPERWYPRRFDIYGSSHQLMHILVVCGAACYAIGILKAEAYWKASAPIGPE